MTDELEDLKRRLVIGRKRDGRSVYDETAKAELVALCMQPGTSVSRLARECGVNANQLSAWVRQHERKNAPPAQAQLAQVPTPAFVPVTVEATPTAPAEPALDLQARLPNGVVIDLRGCDLEQAGRLVEALGRMRCSVSTKG